MIHICCILHMNKNDANALDLVDITRADNAIPMMIGLSTVFSGFDKSVFSAKTFQEGWALSQSVAQTMASTSPQFMEAARRFL